MPQLPSPYAPSSVESGFFSSGREKLSASSAGSSSYLDQSSSYASVSSHQEDTFDFSSHPSTAELNIPTLNAPAAGLTSAASGGECSKAVPTMQSASSSSSNSPTSMHVVKRARVINTGNDLLEDVREQFSYVKGANMFAPTPSAPSSPAHSSYMNASDVSAPQMRHQDINMQVPSQFNFGGNSAMPQTFMAPPHSSAGAPQNVYSNNNTSQTPAQEASFACATHSSDFAATPNVDTSASPALVRNRRMLAQTPQPAMPTCSDTFAMPPAGATGGFQNSAVSQQHMTSHMSSAPAMTDFSPASHQPGASSQPRPPFDPGHGQPGFLAQPFRPPTGAMMGMRPGMPPHMMGAPHPSFGPRPPHMMPPHDVYAHHNMNVHGAHAGMGAMPPAPPHMGAPGSMRLLKPPSDSFLHQVINNNGAFRTHPLFPLLRDLIIADMNFAAPSFPFRLIANLPSDFDKLLQNYLNRNQPTRHTPVDPQADTVIMDALRYAHQSLISKINHAWPPFPLIHLSGTPPRSVEPSFKVPFKNLRL